MAVKLGDIMRSGQSGGVDVPGELNQSDSETPRHIRGWVIPTLAFRKEIC